MSCFTNPSLIATLGKPNSCFVENLIELFSFSPILLSNSHYPVIFPLHSILSNSIISFSIIFYYHHCPPVSLPQVKLLKNRKTISLTLDNYEPQKEQFAKRINLVEFDSPLYVGGAPSTVPSAINGMVQHKSLHLHITHTFCRGGGGNVPRYIIPPPLLFESTKNSCTNSLVAYINVQIKYINFQHKMICKKLI